MFRPTLLAAATAACLCMPLESAGQEQLHVIVMADSASPDISSDARASAWRYEYALRGIIPRKMLRTTVLEGQNATRRHLAAAIDSIPADSGARVVFFYVGHGYYNDGRIAGFPCGSLLAPKPQGTRYIPISEVIWRIRQRNPALLVTVNDSCSVSPPAESLLGCMPEGEGAGHVRPLARRLFFETEGLVNINSSSPGEYSLAHFGGAKFDSERDGTPFSAAFSMSAYKHADVRLDWRTFSSALSRQTAAAFKNTAPDGRLTLGPGRVIAQQSQTVQLYLDGRLQRF